jgi:AcrR family transcriptional regulator
VARQADPDLEHRILTAARLLWNRGAGKAMTMRAIARAARTNTPAVYRRFSHRDDILRALLLHIRAEITEELQASLSVEEACERYIDYALHHPNDYELYYLHEYELLFADKSSRNVTLNQLLKQKRPAVELMKGKLAAQLGGVPDDHERLTLALWALLHGTVMLLIAKTIQPLHKDELRAASRMALDTLLRQSSHSRR